MKKLLIALTFFSLTAAGCEQTNVTKVQENDEKGEDIVETNDYDYYITKESYSDPLFHDPESGISFSLTLDADYLDVNESSEGPKKMVSFRIQNYDPEGPDKIMLNDMEYYIELTIDYAENSRIDNCASFLTSIETVEANEGTRYFGYPDQGGDSSGERYAICFNGNGPDYFLQITDNNTDHPVRELIKESFFQM